MNYPSRSATHTVQMEWVGIIIVSGGEDNFDKSVGRDDESVLGCVECVCTINDLFKSGSLRRKVGDFVDLPLGLASGLKCSRFVIEDMKKSIRYVRQ
jgi:hypothetical protein